MSIKTQEAHMKTLAELLAHDLGYLYGERESGPNGAKKDFLSKGRAFLAALGRDLGFQTQKVSVNPAGIAVSGEVTLNGTWPSGGGLYVSFAQMAFSDAVLLYREAEDGTQRFKQNHFIDRRWLAQGDYAALLAKLMELRKERAHGRAA